MSELKYKRVLLKLSGEQFQGDREYGIDPAFLEWLSKEIVAVTEVGTELVLVVGAGNMVRGVSFEKNGIERTIADYMGMLATLINGLALTSVLEKNNQPTRLMSRLRAESVAEPYIHRRALRHLEKGRVVIIGGGTGNPYVTTDTAAVLAAVELHCDAVLKATKVDGVYNKDPNQHPDAVKHTTLSYGEALSQEDIQIMDKPALAMANDNKLPIVVFDLLTPGNIKRVVEGEPIGTVIAKD